MPSVKGRERRSFVNGSRRFQVRLDEEVYQELNKLADKCEVSLAFLTEKAIREFLAK